MTARPIPTAPVRQIWEIALEARQQEQAAEAAARAAALEAERIAKEARERVRATAREARRLAKEAFAARKAEIKARARVVPKHKIGPPPDGPLPERLCCGRCPRLIPFSRHRNSRFCSRACANRSRKVGKVGSE